MILDVKEAATRVASALPPGPAKLHSPVLGEGDLRTLQLITNNPETGPDVIASFKYDLAHETGVGQVVLTSSGTSALYLALACVGVQQGDEVLVPTMTFAATANAVVHLGATPCFVDGGLHINTYKLQRFLERETKPTPDRRGRLHEKTGRRIIAIVPVHLLGWPAPMRDICRVAASYGLEVVEDAAQSLGSKSGNKSCGTLGAAGILSFNCNKIVTTMGGGALLTDDEWVAARASDIASQCRSADSWAVSGVGWNFRMNPLAAAVGYGQLEKLDETLEAKARLATRYRECLLGCRGIRILDPRLADGDRPNNWLVAAELDPLCAPQRDTLMKELQAKGLETRAIFPPLHLQAPYRGFPRDHNMGEAEDFAKRVICLPSGPGLVQ